MAIVNQAAYDKLKTQWATDAQIKAQIVKQYWTQWWTDFDTFLSSKTTTPVTTTTTPVTTTAVPKVTTPVTTTVTPVTTTTVPKVTTPVTTTTAPKVTTPVTTTMNIDNLKKLEATWVKPTTIISNIVKQYWKDSTQYKQYNDYLNSKLAVNQPNNISAVKTPTITKTTTIDVKPTDVTKNLWSSLIWKSTEETAKTKIDTASSFKDIETTKKQSDLDASTKLLQTNNKKILDLYWIDENWNVDYTKTNSLAVQIENSRKDYEDKKNKSLEWYSSGRLSQVQWQLRQFLAQRWVDVSNIPQEQIIALSWDIWSKAFTDIYNAKEKAINDIETNNQSAIAKINDLRAKWLLAKNEADISIETLKEKTAAEILQLQKDFANTVFWITDTTTTTLENQKAGVLNAVTQLWTTLWLSWSKLASLNKYINSYSSPTLALQAMLVDLNNPNSDLRKNVLTAEQAALAAQTFTNQIALMKAQASMISAQNSWDSAKGDVKISSTLYPVLTQASIKFNIPEIANIRTQWEYTALMNLLSEQNPEAYNYLFTNINKWVELNSEVSQTWLDGSKKNSQ